MIKILESVREDIISDSETSFPEIACGVVAGTAAEAREYFPCVNSASDPEREFEILPAEMLETLQEIRELHDVILGLCYTERWETASPSVEVIRNWLPSYLCFVLFVQDEGAPELRAFRIHGERVTEEPVEIVSDDDSSEEDADDSEDFVPEQAEDESRDEDRSGPPEPVVEAPLLHEVRRHFSDNRYLGWNYWLTALADARARSDWKTCIELASELERGYDLNAEEICRRTEICDWALFQSGGLDAIWMHYTRRLEGGGADADAHFRLALVFERQGSFDAAWEHLGTCLAGASGGPGRVLVESALHALADEQQSGTEHTFFKALWQRVTGGPQEPAKELARMVTEVLQSTDWRRGREAVSALESLGDADSLGKALESRSAAVQVAVAASLRRINRGLTGSILGEAANSASSPLVRWQAIRHFANNGPSATPVLLRALQQDPDVSVRMAAVEGLGHNGRRDVVPALQRAPAWTDALGESLQQAARSAIEEIESRDPAPPPPPPPPRQPVRSEREAQEYLATYQGTTILLLTVGAITIFLLQRWACAGYLLYAGCVYRLLEPHLWPDNFFSDKPCYTGGRSGEPTSGLGKALNISLLNFPLWFAPPVAWSILWLRGWSWGTLALTLVGGVISALALLMRSLAVSQLACKYCYARADCPRWKHRLESFYGSGIKGRNR